MKQTPHAPAYVTAKIVQIFEIDHQLQGKKYNSI